MAALEVSGGFMAMIMGIYDRLISSISSFFREPVESMVFPSKFVLGIEAGMVPFPCSISYPFTTRTDVSLRFLSLGAVVGGIPMMYREAGMKELDLRAVVYPAIGILGVVPLVLIPSGLLTSGRSFGSTALLLQLAGGFIIVVGPVLPGISISQMLYMLRAYEITTGSISSSHILPLILLEADVLDGIFLTTKVLKWLIFRHPRSTYLIIPGFMFGSLSELFPGIPTDTDLAAVLTARATGFVTSYMVSMKEQRT